MITQPEIENMRDFINNSRAFKLAALAREIGWSPTSFHSWLKKSEQPNRPIPQKKAEVLLKVLKEHRYQPVYGE